MDLWDSIVRVIWDPDGVALVLVDYGDPMWDPVALDGGQLEVQTVALVRAAGVKNYPRENEAHRLSFTLARITAGITEAFKARLDGIIALPRTMSDVLLSFEAGGSYRLKNCAITGFPHGQEEFISREGVAIACGELVADAGTYIPGQTWGEISFNWEDLG